MHSHPQPLNSVEGLAANSTRKTHLTQCLFHRRKHYHWRAIKTHKWLKIGTTWLCFVSMIMLHCWDNKVDPERMEGVPTVETQRLPPRYKGAKWAAPNENLSILHGGLRSPQLLPGSSPGAQRGVGLFPMEEMDEISKGYAKLQEG